MNQYTVEELRKKVVLFGAQSQFQATRQIRYGIERFLDWLEDMENKEQEEEYEGYIHFSEVNK